MSKFCVIAALVVLLVLAPISRALECYDCTGQVGDKRLLCRCDWVNCSGMCVTVRFADDRVYRTCGREEGMCTEMLAKHEGSYCMECTTDFCNGIIPHSIFANLGDFLLTALLSSCVVVGVLVIQGCEQKAALHRFVPSGRIQNNA